MPLINKKLVIVIVNFNNATDTLECIDSVFRNIKYEHETKIVLIDNGSKDDSFIIFKQKFENDERIDLFQNEKNLGFSGGYNLGVRIALSLGPEWILLLNNDTILEKDAITELLLDKYDIIIPKILIYDKPNIIWAAGAHWRFFPPGIILYGNSRKDDSKYNIPGEIIYATGCAIMMKKNVFSKVGGFDDTFESYFEDYDFFYRAKRNGLKVYYHPTSVIYHKISKTLGDYSKKRWYLMGRNSVLFYHKKKYFCPMIIYIHIIWYLFREIIKGNFRFIPSYITGLKDGFVFDEKRKNLVHG